MLDLAYNYATDDGLIHVARLSKLKVLNITDNNCISDVGMKHIARLTQLRKLYVADNYVTDAGKEVRLRVRFSLPKRSPQ